MIIMMCIIIIFIVLKAYYDKGDIQHLLLPGPPTCVGATVQLGPDALFFFISTDCLCFSATFILILKLHWVGHNIVSLYITCSSSVHHIQYDG